MAEWTFLVRDYDRDEHLRAFLSWLTDGPLGAHLLVEDTAGHLREVVRADDIAALVAQYDAWEADQAVRPDEARGE